MIRQCDRGASVFGGAAAKVIDAAGAVQERILAMDVQVDELAHWTAQFVTPPRKTVYEPTTLVFRGLALAERLNVP